MDSGVIQGYFGGIPVTNLEVSQNYPPTWFLGFSTWLKEPNANNARKQQRQGTFSVSSSSQWYMYCRRHEKHFNDFLLNMFKWPQPVFFYFGLPQTLCRASFHYLAFAYCQICSLATETSIWPTYWFWYIRGLITFRYFQGSVLLFALHYVAEKFITFLWWRGGEATLRIVLHSNLLHFREEVEQELLS